VIGVRLLDIYGLGKLVPVKIPFESLDKKLRFVFFPYNAKDVIITSAIIALFGFVLNLALAPFSSFLASTAIFAGLIFAITLFIYPAHIYYNQAIMEYTEEMLRCTLHLSTYVQMGSSMEYAFIETEKNLSGILKAQFHDINTKLERRVVTNLGDAINTYIGTWNEINPHFVKSLRLLQLAGLSEEKERDRLIAETIETLMMNYMSLGKRSAERLSKNTNMLIAGGVLIPIISLLLLPLLSVFMPHLVRPNVIAFIYVVLFPSVVLIAALTFSGQRIQIDTVRIKDSIDYKPIRRAYIYLAIGIMVVFAIPTFLTLDTIMQGNWNVEGYRPLIYAWLLGAGIAIGSYVYARIYVSKYKKLWNEIRDIESDLPFILQSFSTYFTLNTPFENVIDGVIEDYENLGFKSHPAVKGFRAIKHSLLTRKETLQEIVQKQLKRIMPSSKVRAVISQIVGFEQTSQESAAKAAKMIREQVINTYKLDEYVKTLLSDSVGLISITITMLAPLLCAAAVIMTYAIVKSIVYITAQLEAIGSLFGGSGFKFEFIDITNVVPPTFIAIIVGVYLIEIIIILSLFQTQISIGNDYFQTVKNLQSNLVGFVIYTVLLFGGYLAVNLILFKQILGT
jgi:hypothetical protein